MYGLLSTWYRGRVAMGSAVACGWRLNCNAGVECRVGPRGELQKGLRMHAHGAQSKQTHTGFLLHVKPGAKQRACVGRGDGEGDVSNKQKKGGGEGGVGCMAGCLSLVHTTMASSRVWASGLGVSATVTSGSVGRGSRRRGGSVLPTGMLTTTPTGVGVHQKPFQCESSKMTGMMRVSTSTVFSTGRGGSGEVVRF